MPQFGKRVHLPLENDAFDKNTLSASFSPDGNLTSMTYDSESSLKKASALLLETSEQLKTYKQTKSKNKPINTRHLKN
jgi:hypothetical protein